MNPVQTLVDSPMTEFVGWCLVHACWQILLVGIALKLALLATMLATWRCCRLSPNG